MVERMSSRRTAWTLFSSDVFILLWFSLVFLFIFINSSFSFILVAPGFESGKSLKRKRISRASLQSFIIEIFVQIGNYKIEKRWTKQLAGMVFMIWQTSQHCLSTSQLHFPTRHFFRGFSLCRQGSQNPHQQQWPRNLVKVKVSELQSETHLPSWEDSSNSHRIGSYVCANIWGDFDLFS